ncbi:MAG: glycoside hydrolase family 97 N-terminal domain-containing protein, partial [Bacteroidales bacterium]|nr:glycoside hydrolase family 97 N-terminal domain-containing protein [Bacteroidales bacterium]
MFKPKLLLIIMFSGYSYLAFGQNFSLESPDGRIHINVNNGELITYSVKFDSRDIILRSALGFEFMGEEPLRGNMSVISQDRRSADEKWTPVVKSKHAEVTDKYNELHLVLRENVGQRRDLELFVRVYDDGTAFRYKLPRAGIIGDREISRELTTFHIPGNPKAWVVEYKGYSSNNEAEFFERPLGYVNEKTIAGMPFLMDYGDSCWVAITE